MKTISEQEKAMVVDMVQAMLDLITPNFRWISFEVREQGSFHFYFLLEYEDEQDRENARDIVFEVSCLQVPVEDFLDWEEEVIVDNRPIDEVRPPGRPVFGRREEL